MIQSALAALEDGKKNPSKQPFLASMWEEQKKLYEDIYDALFWMDKEERLVSYANQSLGKQFTMEPSHLCSWLEKYPNGICWAITVAAKPEADKYPFPFRILIMVPMVHDENFLNIHRASAQFFAENLWGEKAGMAVGKNAALFLSLCCDENGMWFSSPVTLWGLAEPGHSQIDFQTMPLYAELVNLYMKSKNLSENDVQADLVHEYFNHEFGMVIVTS